jgi:hypothetical protein
MTKNAIQLTGQALTGISEAVVSRHMENLMEASQVHEEIMNAALQKGLSQEEAIKLASEAASKAYNLNWVMLAQDIPEYLLLGTKFGKASKKSTVRMAQMFGEDILGPMAAKTAAYAGSLASEGAEEGYQYIVQQKATEAAKKKIDPTYQPRGIDDMMKDGDFWTSVTFGALGAGVFQTAGRAINERILGRVDPEKAEEQERIKNITNYGPILKQARKAMEVAEANGDIEGYELAKARVANTLIGKAVENGNKDHLTNFLNKGKDGDISAKDKEIYNVDEEDLSYMREKFPDMIEKVNRFAEDYESYTKRGFKPNIASELVQHEFMKEAYVKHLDEKLREEYGVPRF